MSTLSGNLYGVNATNTLNTIPSVNNEPYDLGGRVRIAYDSYTIPTGDEVGTSAVIKLFKLPKGARVVGGQFTSSSTASAGVCQVGYEANGVDTADLDAFWAAQDMGAAAIDLQLPGTAAAYMKVFTAETQVNLTFTTATTSGAGDVLQVKLLYVVD